MDNIKASQAAKAAFDYNKAMQTAYVTSDNNVFLTQNAAANHARTLADKTIEVFIKEADEALLSQDQSDKASKESQALADFNKANQERGKEIQ
jgi:hypothetical protein